MYLALKNDCLQIVGVKRYISHPIRIRSTFSRRPNSISRLSGVRHERVPIARTSALTEPFRAQGVPHLAAQRGIVGGLRAVLRAGPGLAVVAEPRAK